MVTSAQMVMDAVKVDGLALEVASEKLRGDKEVVLQSMQPGILAISPGLWHPVFSIRSPLSTYEVEACIGVL